MVATTYLERAIEDRILEAAAQFPVLLVTGPRQVGKTSPTWRATSISR